MMLSIVLLLAGILSLGDTTECDNKKEKYISGKNTDFQAALEFLLVNDQFAEKKMNELASAEWNYETNLTEHNKNEQIKAKNEYAEFAMDTWTVATSFAWKQFKDENETVYRWFKTLSILGNAALPEKEFSELATLVADMQNVYSGAKVCKYLSSTEEKCTLSLDPELSEIMKYSRDYNELKHVWSKWRDATGRQMKQKYERYVDLSNMAACRNGFSDAGEMWREEFESDTIMEELEEIWKSIEPLYLQLHAYVRNKLIQNYTTDFIKKDGPIPAHLLGNMWAQEWGNIYQLVVPYPEKKFADVTQSMKKKGMTVQDMVKTSEEFFTSLGLIKMTEKFWKRSMFEKPADREVVCHASAHDLYDKDDFRIKMCTTLDMEDLITVHHEMGHIQYYQQYKHQPVAFRQSPNSGFHEAIGDSLVYSVTTPEHLKKIGLLENFVDDKESEINYLMQKALNKLAFSSFSYLVDNWRWKVFDGSINRSELNTQWWNMRLKYQGVCPPVERSEEDLDAAAKYHVIADVPYIRYFISNVIQFQFHEAMCNEAGRKGPLHKCDVYQSKEAGKLLSDMLKLGRSVSWREAMKVITKGKTDKMDASATLKYFRPLYDWLKEQNKDEFIGWKSENPLMCP